MSLLQGNGNNLGFLLECNWGVFCVLEVVKMKIRLCILLICAGLSFTWACDDDAGRGKVGICGDGAIGSTETCDDGNATPGDGCSELCQVEQGWICAQAGSACVRLSENCGNAQLNDGEDCDDGNAASGDGCSAQCSVEEGWLCPDLGIACVKQPNVSKCGNSHLDEGESCDDGNATSGDGCSEQCLVEDGYQCNEQGYHCVKQNDCGDYVRDPNAGETCDDGNQSSGDGCDETCKVEDGFSCPPMGGTCSLVGCGNAFVEDGEDCDLGTRFNTATYGEQGCAENCKHPGSCGDATLQSEFERCDEGSAKNLGGYNQCKSDCSGLGMFCADGLVNGSENCDDGNKVAGDGCNELCKREPGYYCPVGGGACVKRTCGNAALDEGEGCDDGNEVSGDGCTVACRIELGFECPVPGSPCVPVVCGDGKMKGLEQCDDGNTASRDGCDAQCKLEAGWVCPVPAKACVAKRCGDGIMARLEQCDDGNAAPDDGCDDRCQLEEGWYCPTPGAPCVASVCGNSKLEGLESCDDGNAAPNDGCSAQCKLEEGYKCPAPGAACVKIVCGDKLVEGLEQCDDGNSAAGDGCSALCKLEKGFHCPTPGAPCVAAVCGNKIVEGLEQCDDANDAAGDGCSPLCEIEPIFSCTDGECKPVCGDGITLWINGMEECDDGNLISGDGCSSLCKREAGFECTSYSHTPPTSIAVPIVYRDFRSYYEQGTGPGYFTQAMADATGNPSCFFVGRGHPDFDRYSGTIQTTGLVYPDLGPDGRPIMKWDGEGGPYGRQISCVQSFDMWYRSVPGVNIVIKDKLELTQNLALDPSGRSYVFDSSAFFNLDNKGYGNYSTPVSHNYGFTSEFQAYFQYRGGETLSFRGDDDVWVFINGKLALDLGGLHPPCEGSVTLGSDIHPLTGKKWDSRFNIFEGGVYSIVLFHAERHFEGSNFKLTLAGFLNMGTTSCNAVCGDGIIVGAEECDYNLPPEEAKKKGCDACKNKPYCGNSVVEYPEHCDPPGGDCSATCTYAFCGNGQHDADKGEECDGTLGLKPGEHCLSNCKISRCGDAYVDAQNNEKCDDGNSSNDDMCTSKCDAPICGDGIVSTGLGEICDDGVNDGSYGGCSLDCSFRPPYCGDGIADTTQGEDCDNGVNDGSYGGCKIDCKWGPRCGDGVLQSAYEDCDDGNTNDGDGCNHNCRININ